ncbi:MAG: hypothetical protein ABGY75_00515, partial [Gemmataceae bacterium]
EFMTHNKSIPIRVVFRRWRDGGGVIALFPERPADAHGHYCDSYMCVGQHGGSDYHGVVRHTAPATPEESAALAAELTRIGYRFVPVRRASARLHELRREEARRYRTASRSA